VNHLELRIMRSRPDAPFTTFLAEGSGRVIMELYTNLAATVPDYPSIHPLCFHVAFVVDDPDATSTRLQEAGASAAYEETLPDGSYLVMLRDPWGVPLQLVRRTTPFPSH
jgi:hypothetical protein